MLLVSWANRAKTRALTSELLNQNQADRIRDLENIIERLKESFAAISYEALNKNTEQFLSLANQRLKHQTELGAQDLETKKLLIDQNLAAINKELVKVHEVVNVLEKDREQKFGELTTQLKATAEQTAKLQDTTNYLRAVLANTRIRGQWGERMAEDVLRMAGFIEGINYRKQQISTSGSRPDFTFLMPKDLKINMDVKFPLDNYLQFLQSDDENLKESFKQQFLRDAKNRIKEVTGRDYINPEDNTLDYVLVFIPNEQIFSFINEIDGTLLDEALKNKVVLCSPLTLYAFLAVIRQAIDNFNLERTAAQILGLIGSFHKQWEEFCGTLDKMGKRIEDARNEYLALTTTRRTKLEKPLRQIEELRKEKSLPIETFELESLAEPKPE